GFGALGEKDKAAERYVHLSGLLDKSGRRLQAIACCKLALGSLPDHGGAKALLESLYGPGGVSSSSFSLDQHVMSRGPVTLPHHGEGANIPPPMPASKQQVGTSRLPPSSADVETGGDISAAAAMHVETFVRTLSELCATFSGTVLAAQTPSLTDSIAGNTDFLWIIQFSGAAEHTVVVSAQRRFILELTKRVLDVDEGMVVDAMATKLSNKLIGMYVDDVKRAFAAQGHVVHSGPPLPVAGANATYQLRGARALHVPMSSEVGWVQITVSGGL
ncbi:MAG: hypothetical protein AAB426_08480, partial [Myxococcota bacterium]